MILVEEIKVCDQRQSRKRGGLDEIVALVSGQSDSSDCMYIFVRASPGAAGIGKSPELRNIREFFPLRVWSVLAGRTCPRSPTSSRTALSAGYDSMVLLSNTSVHCSPAEKKYSR